MIVIHHNKDLDGFSSGAICKLKYPDAKLIGWDYKDLIPDFEQFIGEEVIMIDITFPLERLLELSMLLYGKLTVIDHHISFKKEVDEYVITYKELPFNYIYESNRAACEIGWDYLFPDKEVPYAITLLGRYDTWRQKEGSWEGETLPFQYGIRVQCTSAESFPDYLFYGKHVEEITNDGHHILKYQEEQDRLTCQRSAFERKVYGGLKAAKEMGLEVFVDDKYETFVDMNNAGICCYLFDAPHNKRYDVGYRRIYSLKELA